MRFRTVVVAALAVGVVVPTGSVALAVEEVVAPRLWAKRMCAAALPGAESAMARFATVAIVPAGSPTSVEAMVARIEFADEMVAGIADVLGGVRDGIVAAGVPRIPNGKMAMVRLRDDLNGLLKGLDAMRAAFGRFLEDPASDPVGAAAEVNAAFAEYLDPDNFTVLDEHWPPRLSRAMGRVRECALLSDAMEGAAAAF